MPVVVKGVEIVIKQFNQGETVSIEGSLGGENWTVITALSLDQYPDEWTDEQGFRHVEIALDNQKSFQYYRYHSMPTSFVWSQYLHFSK